MNGGSRHAVVRDAGGRGRRCAGRSQVTDAATRSRSTRPRAPSSCSRGGCERAASSRRAVRISSPTCTSGTASPRRSGAGTRALRRSRARCRSPPVPSGRGSTLSIMTIRSTMTRLVAALSFGPWRQTWAPRDYAAAVERVRDAIARGDVYQVNLVQHLAAEFAGDPGALAARLAPLNPHNREPYRGDGWAIVSGSPELFLARRGRRVWTCPIKGTRPAGAGAARELARSAKDAAEHVMIVDLERNDLSRVCEPGSVRWPELMATRSLAGVEHMVSTVEGRLRDGVGLAELLAATFPGGSITGAPKIAAVDLIAEIEPVGRGASMGALGRVYGNGDLDLALTIRTFAIAEGQIHLWVGGGVVWDSIRRRRSPSRGSRPTRCCARSARLASSATTPGERSRRRGRGRSEPDERRRPARRCRLRARSRRPRRAGSRARRRGVHARPGSVRDDAGLRRPSVSARAASRSPSGLGRAHRARAARRGRVRVACGARPRAGGDARGGAPALLDAGAARRGASRDRPRRPDPGLDRGCARSGPAARLAAAPAPLGAVAPPRDEVDELRRQHRGRVRGQGARRGRCRVRRRGRDRARRPGDEHLVARGRRPA